MWDLSLEALDALLGKNEDFEGTNTNHSLHFFSRTRQYPKLELTVASSEGFSLLEDAHFPVFSHDVKHAVLVEAAELSIEDIS